MPGKPLDGAVVAFLTTDITHKRPIGRYVFTIMVHVVTPDVLVSYRVAADRGDGSPLVAK